VDRWNIDGSYDDNIQLWITSIHYSNSCSSANGALDFDMWCEQTDFTYIRFQGLTVAEIFRLTTLLT
jgi:hypothetical protein